MRPRRWSSRRIVPDGDSDRRCCSSEMRSSAAEDEAEVEAARRRTAESRREKPDLRWGGGILDRGIGDLGMKMNWAGV